ncbi:MAG: hypothetical protein F9K47_16090 [Burkholderiales bacterium]|nr:MAG: hypothetical protein F9K47_16090 [Burkholderiales bacterium]
MRIIGEREILTEVTRWPIRHRVPFVVLDRGHLCADSHCLLLRREDGEVEVPVAAISVVLIEPGVTVTHEAIRLAADHGTLLLWVGEAGVRLYSVGMPGGKQPLRLVEQVQIIADPIRRLAAAQRLYRSMFDEDLPPTRSIDKLRGMEGARVRQLYQEIAARFGVPWVARAESPSQLRDALGFATSCLYGPTICSIFLSPKSHVDCNCAQQAASCPSRVLPQISA